MDPVQEMSSPRSMRPSLRQLHRVQRDFSRRMLGDDPALGTGMASRFSSTALHYGFDPGDNYSTRHAGPSAQQHGGKGARR